MWKEIVHKGNGRFGTGQFLRIHKEKKETAATNQLFSNFAWF